MQLYGIFQDFENEILKMLIPFHLSSIRPRCFSSKINLFLHRALEIPSICSPAFWTSHTAFSRIHTIFEKGTAWSLSPAYARSSMKTIKTTNSRKKMIHPSKHQRNKETLKLAYANEAHQIWLARLVPVNKINILHMVFIRHINRFSLYPLLFLFSMASP